jgi:hypothetical protein
MSIGYVVDVCLGCLLGYAYFIFSRDTGDHEPQASWKRAVERGLMVFFDSAVYFAIAIELASIVVLAKKDLGLNTDGFGAIQAQISFAVSTVCILPLLYPVTLLGWGKIAHRYGHEKQELREYNSRGRVRRFLFYLCLVLFFYPFVSQCIHNWAPSLVGEGNAPGGTTWITDDEQAKLTELCFGQIAPLSPIESTVVGAFELTASLAIFIYAVFGLLNQLGRLKGNMLLKAGGSATDGSLSTVGPLDTFLLIPDEPAFDGVTIFIIMVLLGPLLLSIPLLWAVFRMRGVQQELARATGSAYVDNDWGFGQVVSLVLFAPVVVEFVQAWLEEVEH